MLQAHLCSGRARSPSSQPRRPLPARRPRNECSQKMYSALGRQHPITGYHDQQSHRPKQDRGDRGWLFCVAPWGREVADHGTRISIEELQGRLISSPAVVVAAGRRRRASREYTAGGGVIAEPTKPTGRRLRPPEPGTTTAERALVVAEIRNWTARSDVEVLCQQRKRASRCSAAADRS